MRGHVGSARDTVTTRRRRLGIVVSAACLTALDLALKELAQAQLTRPVDLPGLDLRVSYNPGVAFSLGDTLPSAVVLGVTALITVVLAAFALATAPRSGPWTRVGLALGLGGALGNVLDRAGDGVVTDYLHTGWFPTFNLADVFITMGTVALLLGSLWEPHRPSPQSTTSTTTST